MKFMVTSTLGQFMQTKGNFPCGTNAICITTYYYHPNKSALTVAYGEFAWRSQARIEGLALDNETDGILRKETAIKSFLSTRNYRAEKRFQLQTYFDKRSPVNYTMNVIQQRLLPPDGSDETKSFFSLQLITIFFTRWPTFAHQTERTK